MTDVVANPLYQQLLVLANSGPITQAQFDQFVLQALRDPANISVAGAQGGILYSGDTFTVEGRAVYNGAIAADGEPECFVGRLLRPDEHIHRY